MCVLWQIMMENKHGELHNGAKKYSKLELGSTFHLRARRNRFENLNPLKDKKCKIFI